LNKNGFSLIEIVFTIIIIGLAMGAITESFIAGSAKSVNIVNEETAVNVAKREMAALNYCRNGGPLTSGVCKAFQTGVGSGSSPWITTSNLSNFAPPQKTVINYECFNTTVTASNVNFNDVSGIGTISGSPTNFIQTIVQTGWFAANGGGTSCPAAPANYPYVTLSTVYADY
jgi:prepilin-type N-terminal cleavage/methylation domain-containing protein